MSDAPQGPGWWKASDGKWYPPLDAAPAPGWWLASDGRWYPPELRPTATRTLVTEGRPARPPGSGGAKRPVRKPVGPPIAVAPTEQEGSAPASAPHPAPASVRNGPVSRPRTIRPNRQVGLTPEEQIARREEASRLHAATVAEARAAAASRALAGLGVTLSGDRDSRGTHARPTPDPAASATPAGGGGNGNRSANSKDLAPDPLLEVTPSRLATDIEHIGERLVIFADRVELRDRSDGVRQSVTGEEITDIVVHRKLTGAVLSIETATGPAIVAKGLRPEQAEEARHLILRKTRRTGPVTRQTQRRTGSEPGRARPAGPPPNEAELTRKLTDLHRAGVLTDDELRDKLRLVARLARDGHVATAP